MHTKEDDMNRQHAYNKDAPKRHVSLSANSDLIGNAKKAGINLSQTFEDALVVKLRASLEEDWLKENKEAIAAFNERIEKNGVFGARQRRF
jgi:antitoxin CcdA